MEWGLRVLNLEVHSSLNNIKNPLENTWSEKNRRPGIQIANETYQLSNHDNCHYSIPFNNKIGENRKPFVWERQKPFHYCCYSNDSSIRSISNIDSSDVHKVGRILESLLPILISIHFRYSPPSIRTLSMDLGYCG